MTSTDEPLDELIESCRAHEDPTGETGFLKQIFRTTLSHSKKIGLPGHTKQPSEEERR